MHRFETKIDFVKFDFVKYYILVLILRQIFLAAVNIFFNNFLNTYIDGIAIAILTTLYYLHFNNNYDFEKIGKATCIFLLFFNLIYGGLSQTYVNCVFYNTFLFALGFYLFFNFKQTILLTLSTLLIFPLNAIIAIIWPLKVVTPTYENYLITITMGFDVILFLILLYYYTEIKKNNAMLDFFKNEEKILSESNIKKQILPNPNDFYTTLFKKIDAYMNSKEPWRNAEYNLEQLAKDVNSNVFQISTAINYCKKHNFKTYLNDFRLNAFETQIKKMDTENFLLKEIYLDIGFNSRVTFNRTFKNKFGKTPQEYISDLYLE